MIYVTLYHKNNKTTNSQAFQHLLGPVKARPDRFSQPVRSSGRKRPVSFPKPDRSAQGKYKYLKINKLKRDYFQMKIVSFFHY